MNVTVNRVVLTQVRGAIHVHVDHVWAGARGNSWQRPQVQRHPAWAQARICLDETYASSDDPLINPKLPL